jgi:hypothetical protein
MKVGFKARHNRRRNPSPHKDHHNKKLPTVYDRLSARDRRSKILYMRMRDLDD